MPNKDQPLDFPSKGLNVSREFGEQPQYTTADAVNVASRDSIAGRNRGGSRTGFSKYVAAQSSAGAAKIQMLEVIVDPSIDALPQNFNTPDDDWVPHPRIPTILIPPGGSPWSPNPNAGQPSREITHVQSKRKKFDADTIEQSVAFTSSVTFGNTLVVLVGTSSDATSGMGVTVKNASSPTGWTQVGSYIEIVHPIGGNMRLSCWMKTANSGSDDNTVKVTPAAEAEMAITILEYRGMPTSSQVDNAVTNSDASLSPPAPATTGGVSIGGSHEMVLGAFLTNFDTSAFTPGAGFTCRPSADNGVDVGAVPELRLNVVEKTGLSLANNPTIATGTTTGGEDPYVAIGASFKKS